MNNFEASGSILKIFESFWSIFEAFGSILKHFEAFLSNCDYFEAILGHFSKFPDPKPRIFLLVNWSFSSSVGPIFPDFENFLKMLQNASKMFKIWENRTHGKRKMINLQEGKFEVSDRKFWKIAQNCFKIIPIASKCFKMLQNASKLLQNASKLFIMLPSCFKMLQNSSNSQKMF